MPYRRALGPEGLSALKLHPKDRVLASGPKPRSTPPRRRSSRLAPAFDQEEGEL